MNDPPQSLVSKIGNASKDDENSTHGLDIILDIEERERETTTRI